MSSKLTFAICLVSHWRMTWRWYAHKHTSSIPFWLGPRTGACRTPGRCWKPFCALVALGMALAPEVVDFFALHSLQLSAGAPAGQMGAPPGSHADVGGDFLLVAGDLRTLWASKPQERGGARLWKQRVLALMTRLGRMETCTVRQHVREWVIYEMRAASSGFKASRTTSWRPFVLVCLRLVGCEVSELRTLTPVPRPSDLRMWLARGKARLEQRFLIATGSKNKRSSSEVSDLFPRTMKQKEAMQMILQARSAKELFSDLDAASIRKAYHMLARLVHPDKCDDPDAKRCFQQLQNYTEGMT